MNFMKHSIKINLLKLWKKFTRYILTICLMYVIVLEGFSFLTILIGGKFN